MAEVGFCLNGQPCNSWTRVIARHRCGWNPPVGRADFPPTRPDKPLWNQVFRFFLLLLLFLLSFFLLQHARKCLGPTLTFREDLRRRDDVSVTRLRILARLFGFSNSRVTFRVNLDVPSADSGYRDKKSVSFVCLFSRVWILDVEIKSKVYVNKCSIRVSFSSYRLKYFTCCNACLSTFEKYFWMCI